MATALACLAASCGPSGHPACRVRGSLPDPSCTPGAADARVQQSNIGHTICTTGYSRRVRPPYRFSAKLKRRQIAAYGAYAGRQVRDYEEDHLLPLELGGAPKDPRNMWPQANASLASRKKDLEENFLHRQVCTHEKPLRLAQLEMTTNWLKAYLQDMPEGR
ncbi:MAG: hypothetical protein NVSMB25_14770 [Thermoleophilaceae bacterium]